METKPAWAEPLLVQLRRRHFDAFFCADAEAVRQQVLNLIPVGSSVTWGGSASVRSVGLPDLLKAGNFVVYDRDEAQTPAEKQAIYRKAFDCDYYLSSVNALSADGQVVNIDGNGNRVAAITWGPRFVIFIVGRNKICPDLPSAIDRARQIAAPVNMQRFDLRTPCKIDQRCHDCLSPDSICNYFEVLRQSHPSGRHIVLLVDADLGF